MKIEERIFEFEKSLQNLNIDESNVELDDVAYLVTLLEKDLTKILRENLIQNQVNEASYYLLKEKVKELENRLSDVEDITGAL